MLLQFAGKQDVVGHLKTMRESLPKADLTSRQYWIAQKDLQRVELEASLELLKNDPSSTKEIKGINKSLSRLNTVWDVVGTGLFFEELAKRLFQSKELSEQKTEALLQAKEAIQNIKSDSEIGEGIALFEAENGDLSETESLFLNHGLKMPEQCRMNPAMRGIAKVASRFDKEG